MYANICDRNNCHQRYSLHQHVLALYSYTWKIFAYTWNRACPFFWYTYTYDRRWNIIACEYLHMKYWISYIFFFFISPAMSDNRVFWFVAVLLLYCYYSVIYWAFHDDQKLITCRNIFQQIINNITKFLSLINSYICSIW